jgi:hypothetical protein
MFNNPFSALQKTHFISITETKLFGQVIYVCYENYMEPCGQNAIAGAHRLLVATMFFKCLRRASLAVVYTDFTD